MLTFRLLLIFFLLFSIFSFRIGETEMHCTYATRGTCSRQIDFDIDSEGKLRDVRFLGGCNGNLKGIGKLCEGMEALAVADRLEGTFCGMKSTSCPDQLAKAIRQALEK